MNTGSFDQLCGHLGMDPSGDPLSNIQELMNFSLQCLGGIRILFQSLEKQRNSTMLKSLDDISHWQDLGVQYWSMKKVFQDSLLRMMQAIMVSDEQSIDPCRHIVESFPNGSTIGKQNWMAAHWAILGDPSKHTYDVSRKLAPSSLLQIENVEDDRIFVVNSLAKILPRSFTETDREGRSVLHIAARLDSVLLFESVLHHTQMNGGPRINDANLNGALPLHNTARFSRSLELLQRVEREYPPAIKAINHEGLLPLHWAAVKNRSPDILKHLIEVYPDGIKEPNLEGYLPMHCAGQNDCLEVVEVVYKAFPEGIRVTDNEGGLPLHHACCFAKNVEVVKFIYEAHPDAISVKQQDGITPMHLAASQNDSPELLRFLLRVSPNAASVEDDEGWVALRCIADRLKEEMSARRLECFRILLHANPTAAAQIGLIEERDVISRLSLNALPSINVALYRELNWIARRQQLCLMLNIARDHFVVARIHQSGQDTPLSLSSSAASTASVHPTTEYAPAVVLIRLCHLYVSADSRVIPSGVLRKILKFI
jgi:ankyrin repeat protein